MVNTAKAQYLSKTMALWVTISTEFLRFLLKGSAPAPGLEPGTIRLTVECSAN
jgi:hypothetical protein